MLLIGLLLSNGNEQIIIKKKTQNWEPINLYFDDYHMMAKKCNKNKTLGNMPVFW